MSECIHGFASYADCPHCEELRDLRARLAAAQDDNATIAEQLILRQGDMRILNDRIDSLESSNESLRDRLAAAESRLREYEESPVVAWMWEYMGTHFSEGANRPEFLPHDPSYKTKQLIIRPRGGKGE